MLNLFLKGCYLYVFCKVSRNVSTFLFLKQTLVDWFKFLRICFVQFENFGNKDLLKFAYEREVLGGKLS